MVQQLAFKELRAGNLDARSETLDGWVFVGKSRRVLGCTLVEKLWAKQNGCCFLSRNVHCAWREHRKRIRRAHLAVRAEAKALIEEAAEGAGFYRPYLLIK